MRASSVLLLTLLTLLTSFSSCRDGDAPPPSNGSNGSSRSSGLTSAERVAEALPRFKAPPVKIEQDDPRTIRAISLIAAGRLAEARAELELVLREFPGAGHPCFLLGYTHHKEKRYAQAKPYFERALEIGPTFDKPYVVPYFYGWCLWYLGDRTGTRAAFEAVLELTPDERDAHFGLGLIAVEDGRLDDALQHFQRSIEITEALAGQADPNSTQMRQYRRELAKVHAGVADVQIAKDDVAGAKENLIRCVQLHPDAYEAWFKLSRVLARLGDDAGAEEARRQHDAAKQRMGRSG